MQVLLALGGLICVAALPLIGWKRFSLIFFLLAATLAPWRLLSGGGPWHVGIADPVPTPTTYGIALLLLLAISAGGNSRRLWTASYVTVMVGYLFAWTVLFWNGTPANWSGMAHLMSAALALVAGSFVSQDAQKSRRFESTLVCIVGVVVAVELVVSLAQLVGMPISVYGEIGRYLAEGRPIGTFNHPTSPGKAIVLLQIPLLIATTSADSRIRGWAWAGLILGIPATAISLSRANTVAVVSGIVLWIMLARQDIGSGKRSAAFILVTALSVPMLGLALERFDGDAKGGSRPELLEAGLAQIARTPWVGTGPNAYVAVAGKYDALVGSGVPVHQAFLLIVAELGIVGGVLFYAPLLLVAARSVATLKEVGPKGVAARAFISTLPGVILIAATGWGVLSESLLLLWWFVVGYAGERIIPRRSVSAEMVGIKTPVWHSGHQRGQ